jgi:ceramide glucosyltransferase
MLHSVLNVCAAAAAIAVLCGFGYTVLAMWGAVRFLWKRENVAAMVLPSVSILKPLKGSDPEILENFRSHCRQNYSDYEIVFGVSDGNDPAIATVEQLRLEFPSRTIKLVVSQRSLGTNAKVSNLAQMVPAASYEYLIVNDSDIRVDPNYLRRVMSPIANPRTGLVTCLYRGIPAATFGSWLEAGGIVDFASGVLAARQVDGGIQFGLGSTLAFRRQDLQVIGGFDALADFLADDYQLGHRLTSEGADGELAHSVVETVLPAYSLPEYLSHQVRWARTIRDSRRWGYAGMAFTYYLPWALLTLLCTGGAVWAWFLLVAASIIRMTSTLAVGYGVLNDRRTFKYLAFIPVRDLLAVAVWLTGFLGHTVKWRGESFSLKNGKLQRIYP